MAFVISFSMVSADILPPALRQGIAQLATGVRRSGPGDADRRGPSVPPNRKEAQRSLGTAMLKSISKGINFAAVQLRRATLYPAELRVRRGSFSRLPCCRQCPGLNEASGAGTGQSRVSHELKYRTVGARNGRAYLPSKRHVRA